MPEPDLFAAREQFIDFPEPSVPVVIRAGTLARAGHPIIDRNPGMWVPAEVTYDVERLKAEPRQTTRKISSG